MDAAEGLFYEVPFYLRSHGPPKFVSGITRTTTCSDVIASLLRSEGKEDDARLDEYVLMEQWRGVDRILSRQARVLKLWLAWGEEQEKVRFQVKRVRGRGPAGGRSRRRRRNSVSSNASGDLHPRKMSSREIEGMMEEIMRQGERICQELRSSKQPDSTESSPLSDPPEPMTLIPKTPGNTRYSRAAASLFANPSSSATNLSKLHLDEEVEVDDDDESCSEINHEMHKLQLLVSELDSLVALNDELQSAETKHHILSANLAQFRHARGHAEPQLDPGSVEEIKRSLDMLEDLKSRNSRASGDIEIYKGHLGHLDRLFKEKRDLVKCLEYDVNVIEKEGRKLSKELDKVLRIEIPEQEGDSSEAALADSQVIYTELKELQLECAQRKIQEESSLLSSKFDEETTTTTGSSEAASRMIRTLTTASPEGSSSGMSSGAESAGNSNLFVSDVENSNKRRGPPGGVGILSELKADSNSDTGLSSLHSSGDEEGELVETLV